MYCGTEKYDPNFLSGDLCIFKLISKFKSNSELPFVISLEGKAGGRQAALGALTKAMTKAMTKAVTR
jgi:hypothetical protein